MTLQKRSQGSPTVDAQLPVCVVPSTPSCEFEQALAYVKYKHMVDHNGSPNEVIERCAGRTAVAGQASSKRGRGARGVEKMHGER